MAIITRSICKCSRCGHEWIPANGAEPAQVKRCAACKSWAWNDDDPKVAHRKAQPRKPNPKQVATQAKPAPKLVPSLPCLHRILLKDCRICRGAN